MLAPSNPCTPLTSSPPPLPTPAPSVLPYRPRFTASSEACESEMTTSPSSALVLGYCSRLQMYHHSVGWADDSTCPDCYAADHTHHFSCPTHPTELALGDIWVAQFLLGLLQFSNLCPLQIDFYSFPVGPLLLASSAGPLLCFPVIRGCI